MSALVRNTGLRLWRSFVHTSQKASSVYKGRLYCSLSRIKNANNAKPEKTTHENVDAAAAPALKSNSSNTNAATTVLNGYSQSPKAVCGESGSSLEQYQHPALKSKKPAAEPTPSTQPAAPTTLQTLNPGINVAPKSKIVTLALTDEIRDELTHEISKDKRSPYTHYFDMMDNMEAILRRVIPSDIQETVRQMGLTHDPQAILIKNCPVNKQITPTREEDRHYPEDGHLEESFMLGMAGLRLCKPFHDRSKKSGELFNQVRTIKGYENKANSRGALKYFPSHTELVNQQRVLDFVTLLCKKGDPQAGTGIISVDNVIKGLPASIIQDMQRPEFNMKPGDVGNGTATATIAPILEPDYRGGYFIRLNANFDTRVQGLSPAAERVVEVLKRHFEAGIEHERVYLERGDCLTVSNKKAMHDRNSYVSTIPWAQRRDMVRLYENTNSPKIIQELLRSQSKPIVKGSPVAG